MTVPIIGENHRIIGLICLNFYMDIHLSPYEVKTILKTTREYAFLHINLQINVNN